MTISQLYSAIKRYEAALTELETELENAVGNLSDEVILSVLIARDAVQAELTAVTQIPKRKLIAVTELDGSLKKQARSIAQTVQLADWRASFNPPKEAWWWFLEIPIHPLDRFDWLWSAFQVVFLTGSLSLVVDISSRFLSGGLDVLSSFTVVSQSVLTLLTVGGALTKAGQTAIEQAFLRLGIQQYLWQEIKLGLSGLLLLSLIGFRASLPQIATYFNEQGLEKYIAGEWAIAQSHFERAIGLNPDDAQAHYNLGRLYEDLQDLDQAKAQYRLALRGGLDVAYNALARLSIQNKKYPEAVSLLLKGLEIATKENDQVRYTLLKYALLKNLGWARLKQKRYADAESNLREAIRLDQKSASAHCLLAQVLEERKGAPKSALKEWEICLRYANPRYPEEDIWIGMAQERIDGKGKR